MTRSEDGDDAIPVLGLEAFRGIDDDEADRFYGVDGGDEAGGVEEGVGGGGHAAAVRGDVDSCLEEGFDV